MMELKNYKTRDYIPKEILLLPLISKSPDEAKKWIGHGLIGIYNKDTNKPQWGEKIILVYNGKTHDLRPIINWNLSEYRYETYQEIKDGKTYHIFAYIIPPKYKKDYKLIVNGDYSKISIQTETIITDFYKKIDPKELNYLKTIKKILHPPLSESLNHKNEYTDAFGEKQILNINDVPLS